VHQIRDAPEKTGKALAFELEHRGGPHAIELRA
jgi:hypothetical protein